VRDGLWSRIGLYPLKRRVFGRKVGILGLSRIGFEVGKRLAGFGMDFAYCDISAKNYATNWRFIADPVALAEQVGFLFVTLAALDVFGGERLDDRQHFTRERQAMHFSGFHSFCRADPQMCIGVDLFPLHPQNFPGA
jgi:hypothetical protein